MLKIIDKYILKRYLATFSVMLLLFIPIGIPEGLFRIQAPKEKEKEKTPLMNMNDFIFNISMGIKIWQHHRHKIAKKR